MGHTFPPEAWLETADATISDGDGDGKIISKESGVVVGMEKGMEKGMVVEMGMGMVMVTVTVVLEKGITYVWFASTKVQRICFNVSANLF